MSSTLDFRDIHQHPPSAVQAGQPLPHDPSWDAHKVYFNEREKGPAYKGDDFDDFFDPRLMEEKENQEVEKDGNDPDISSMEAPTPQPISFPEHEDENLDPLGWPVDAFRSDRISTNILGPEEDGEDDDLNLLRKSSDEDDLLDENNPHAALAARLTNIVEGIGNIAVLDSRDSDDEQGQQEEGQDTASVSSSDPSEQGPNENLNKYERIRIYETTVVDEESSVEEEDPADDEEWEKDRDVTYIPQTTSLDEEDDGIDNAAMFSLPPTMEDAFVASFPEEETEVPAAAVPTFTIPPLKEKPSTKANGPLPLLRPPPAEKLAKWEEEKARAANFLQQMEENEVESSKESK